MKPVVMSPEEQALLQIARNLGIVGALLEQARQKEVEQKKAQAYDKALHLAEVAYRQAIGNGAKVARVEVTVEVDGTEATAIYPAAPRSTKTASGKHQNYPEGLVAALKEESQKRGTRWYGVENAIRTKWGRAIYEQFTSSQTTTETDA